MTDTATVTPTVVLMIGGSAITRDERGEIVETVDFLPDGSPDWSGAGICDPRGGAGDDGFAALVRAIDAAEENARLLGFEEIARIPS